MRSRLRPGGRAIHAMFIAAASAALGARPAHACESMPLELHQLDPKEVGADTTLPERPRVTGLIVSRSYGPRNEGCGQAGSSCDGSGGIGIELAAGVDDRTPPDKIGYRIQYIGGQMPSGLQLPGIVRPQGGFIWLHYSDPGPADQPPIDVSFQLFAVDLAGNESIGSDTVRAQDPGDEGCSVARGGGSFGAALFGAAAAILAFRIAWRRHRSRRASISGRWPRRTSDGNAK